MADVNLSKAVRANLLSLQNTASMMGKTQERLATGMKVTSALDNPTNFFTASALNSRASDMASLLDSMSNGIKTLETADNGLKSITKTVESMQSTLRQARQDKSFQAQSFEVTASSTLKVNGGSVGDLPVDITLQAPTGGTKATLTTSAVYNNPTLAAGETAGAQAQVTYHATMDSTKLKVDGVETAVITNGTPGSAATYATALQTALNTSHGSGKYTVANNAGVVSIQATDTSAASPKVEFAATVTQATKGVTSFTYDPAGTTGVTAGGQAIAAGGSFEDFVAGLQSKAAAGNYEVVADATTKKITLSSTAYNVAAPVVSGLTQQTTAQTTGTVGYALGNQITIEAKAGSGGSQQVLSTNGLTDATAKTAIEGALTQAGWSGFAVTVSTGALTIRSTTPGAKEAVNLTAGSGSTVTAETAGVDGVTNYSTAAGTAGAFTKEVAAAADKFTLNYGGKNANISVVTGTEAQRAASINTQLAAQGMSDVEASFALGKLSFTSKSAEAKTMAIGGENVSVFGTGTIATGAAAISAYTTTNAVDQFVEEVNRSHGDSLRASNDNGKLRIENLSTQKLDVSFDKDGAGSTNPVSSKIGGNAARENFSKQFNELRDQLDKFADDASFNGINLLRGDKLTLTFNESGSSTISIQAKDNNGAVRAISAGNMGVESLVASNLDKDSDIDSLLGTLGNALKTLRSQSSTFGSNLSVVQNRQDFTKSMINTLETGAANLTLADTNAEAANLLALQTRQQLSSTALSMASQADQAVLRLF